MADKSEPDDNSKPPQQAPDEGALRAEEVKEVYNTLCTLMTSASGNNSECPRQQCSSPTASEQACFDARSDCFKSCPKQLQLPMFLSSTFVELVGLTY